MPRVLPWSSTPSHRDRSHFPAFSAAWAWGMLRAWASNKATVCSAAERMFDCGALTTITPRLVAAATSTLSTPMPARPTTIRSWAASSTGSVTLVAERIISASAPPTASTNSSGDKPKRTSTEWPASRRRPKPPSAISSVTRIRATRRSYDPTPSGLREQLGQAVEALFEVVVAQGVGEPGVTRGAEGLAGDDGDFGLVEDGDAQLGGGLGHAPADLTAEQLGQVGVGVERP